MFKRKRDVPVKVTVLIPHSVACPNSQHLDELLCLVAYALHQPLPTTNTSTPTPAIGLKPLNKTPHTSWRSRLTQHKERIGPAASSAIELFESTQGTSISASAKRRFKTHIQSTTQTFEIEPVAWIPLAQRLDPQLAQRAGLVQQRDTDWRQVTCWACGVNGDAFVACGECGLARYCSPKCQQDAFWHHRETAFVREVADKYGCCFEDHNHQHHSSSEDDHGHDHAHTFPKIFPVVVVVLACLVFLALYEHNL
ncbi:hypothetical protein HDU77_004499 [Chytriomyces hyalinus]|nr:hypothetical protein HDU77_004499 [Chytriomyces hyalinus]